MKIREQQTAKINRKPAKNMHGEKNKYNQIGKSKVHQMSIELVQF